MTANKGLISTSVLVVMAVVGLGLYNYLENRVQSVTIPGVLETFPNSPKNNSILLPVVIGKKVIKQLDLNNKQVVRIYGEIGQDSYYTAKHITELSKSGRPIYILINSPGGSVMDGALIVSAIEASPVPVYTICEEMCASMAFIIHQYGHTRMMVDRSLLMGHPASGAVQGTVEQMDSRLSAIHRYVNKFNAFIAKRAGLTLEEYLPMRTSEQWLDAEDATNLKFNDQIVNVNLAVGNPDTISILEQKKNSVKESVNLQW